VDYLQGLGRPPESLDWSAVTRDGLLLPDGFYKAHFVWADEKDARHQTPTVEVSILSPPGLREILGRSVRLAFDGPDAVLRVAEALPFRPGEAEVKKDAIPALDGIARFLLRYPEQRVTVQGHADSLGSEEANRKVSLRRAQAIYAFFAERGVEPSRMSYEGLGADRPVASNATADGRARNRRVDIVLNDAAL
jgi:outer membrane protein OmpA-like peptidoglycan-associated protein